MLSCLLMDNLNQILFGTLCSKPCTFQKKCYPVFFVVENIKFQHHTKDSQKICYLYGLAINIKKSTGVDLPPPHPPCQLGLTQTNQSKACQDVMTYNVMIVCLSEAFKFSKAKSSIRACLSNLVQLTKSYCQTSIKYFKKFLHQSENGHF